MKLKLMMSALLLGVFSTSHADNRHEYPENKSQQNQSMIQAGIQARFAGYCEIEIINQSYEDARVSGVYEDGIQLEPFTIYSFDAPHYISLFYYGFCHYGMNLYIDSYYGYNMYSGYTTRESTIRLVSYLKGNPAKAELVRH